MTRGVWLAIAIAVALGTAYGWYRENIERAKQQGIAIEMARRAHLAQARFDSIVRRDEPLKRASDERLARLAHDSASAAEQRRLLVLASQNATQRAESILSSLVDSLPQLAGVRAAMDTLKLEALSYKGSWEISESQKAELTARVAALTEQLDQAKLTIAEQGGTIAQLQQAGSTRGGVNPLAVALGVVVVGGSIALGATVF